MPTSAGSCVFTVLFGGYERLHEQAVARGSTFDFICITDNPALRSDSWRIRLVEPLLPQDLARSSRFAKLCPHRFLPEHQRSLYIDNSVELKLPPEQIWEELFATQPHGLACLRHSYRASLFEEYDEVIRVGFDDAATCYEQLEHYLNLGLDESVGVIWGGFLMREHHRPEVIACMESWLANVLRYSRRDQLSFPMVARQLAFPYTAHVLDNFDSKFHQWPLPLDRDRSGYIRASAEVRRPTALKLIAARRELAADRELHQQTRTHVVNIEGALAHANRRADELEAERARLAAALQERAATIASLESESASLRPLLHTAETLRAARTGLEAARAELRLLNHRLDAAVRIPESVRRLLKRLPR